MTDRPTSPDPADQPRPADETAPLPPQSQAAPYPVPGAVPPAADAGWPPVAAAAAPVAGPARSGPRRWWDDATSTGAGRGALIAVAVLASLLLVTGVGLTAAFVATQVDDRDDDTWSSQTWGPGMGNGRGNGNGNGKSNGNGRGWGHGNGPQGQGNGMMGDDEGPRQGPQAGPGNSRGNGNGNGNGNGLGRGAAMLGAGVLHGEFTTDLTGTPTVMVVQTGQVTAYTAGKSLTVKSSDGFEATYALDGSAFQSGGSRGLANGVQVRVVAAKEGMKVTALFVG